jgi:hypothetical protein
MIKMSSAANFRLMANLEYTLATTVAKAKTIKGHSTAIAFL